MKAFNCPICGSKLEIYLHYHKVNHYFAEYDFMRIITYLATPSEIGRVKEKDYYVLDEIFLLCSNFDSGNCDFEHSIEMSEYYATLDGLFEDASEIVDKECKKNGIKG